MKFIIIKIQLRSKYNNFTKDLLYRLQGHWLRHQFVEPALEGFVDLHLFNVASAGYNHWLFHAVFFDELSNFCSCDVAVTLRHLTVAQNESIFNAFLLPSPPYKGLSLKAIGGRVSQFLDRIQWQV